jgi:hypothetical protein
MVEQSSIPEDRANRFLRHLLEVVTGDLTGDDDPRVIGHHHQPAELT